MASPPPRRQSMSALKSKILQPSLTSHYEVYIQAPTEVNSYITLTNAGPGLSIDGTKLEDRLSVPCTEASLPGSRVATHELKDDYTGITQKHAHRRLYDDSANFTFYVDAEEYYVIRYFEGWLSWIHQENQSGPDRQVFRQNFNHRMAFPRSYYADELSITKFERDYNIESGKLTYQFRDAFPIGLSAMPMSYDSSQLMKCTVEFQFSRYIVGRS
tara:strand:- start:45 stop:689 length:645 start_codon:yes stop_codon:yes gene_type:complete